MTELSHESNEVTKVLVTACTWVDRRKAVQIAPEGKPKARAAGLYKQSGNELAQAVEKYRRAGER